MAIYISDKPAAEEKTVASETGRFYYSDGRPAYTIVGKNGKERATTLRDAKALGLYVSTTTVIRMAHSHGLERWKNEQMMLAALTLPRNPGETDEAFIARVIEDSQTTTRAAADRGTLVHGAIERWLLSGGKEAQGDAQSLVDETYKACLDVGIDLLNGDPERSFAHNYGYAGKIDWSSSAAVVDFKTKGVVDKRTKAYDEHLMQLAAYDKGLGGEPRRLLNVFIGCDNNVVRVHEWKPEDTERGFGMFMCLLDFYKHRNNYWPNRSVPDA